MELEVVTTRLAAVRADEDDLADLERLNREWMDLLGGGDTDAQARINVQFHIGLARAAHNPVFVAFIDALEGLLYETALAPEYPDRRAGLRGLQPRVHPAARAGERRGSGGGRHASSPGDVQAQRAHKEWHRRHEERSVMLRQLEYAAPASLQEACGLLSQVEGAMALAGGTDVVVSMNHGKTSPSPGGRSEATRRSGRGDEIAGFVEIGALVSMTTLTRSPIVKRWFPALALAAGSIGCWQVRNLATLGGNLCNASPSADATPPLLGLRRLGAARDGDRTRELPLERLPHRARDDGPRPGRAARGAAHPEAAGRPATVYVRRAIRRSMDIPLVNVAVGVRLDGRRRHRGPDRPGGGGPDAASGGGGRSRCCVGRPLDADGHSRPPPRRRLATPARSPTCGRARSTAAPWSRSSCGGR